MFCKNIEKSVDENENTFSMKVDVDRERPRQETETASTSSKAITPDFGTRKIDDPDDKMLNGRFEKSVNVIEDTFSMEVDVDREQPKQETVTAGTSSKVIRKRIKPTPNFGTKRSNVPHVKMLNERLGKLVNVNEDTFSMEVFVDREQSKQEIVTASKSSKVITPSFGTKRRVVPHVKTLNERFEKSVNVNENKISVGFDVDREQPKQETVAASKSSKVIRKRIKPTPNFGIKRSDVPHVKMLNERFEKSVNVNEDTFSMEVDVDRNKTASKSSKVIRKRIKPTPSFGTRRSDIPRVNKVNNETIYQSGQKHLSVNEELQGIQFEQSAKDLNALSTGNFSPQFDSFNRNLDVITPRYQNRSPPMDLSTTSIVDHKRPRRKRSENNVDENEILRMLDYFYHSPTKNRMTIKKDPINDPKICASLSTSEKKVKKQGTSSTSKNDKTPAVAATQIKLGLNDELIIDLTCDEKDENISSPIDLSTTSIVDHKSPLRKRSKYNVDEKEILTISDYFYHNPTKNRITIKKHSVDDPKICSSTSEKKGKKQGTSSTSTSKSQNDKTPAVAATQLKLGLNDEIIIDLTTETTSQPETISKSETLHLDENTGFGGFYHREQRSKKWSDDETAKFYRCLQTVGTDFSAMQQFFPDRCRKQLKIKFKNEEKCNLHLIDKALKYPKAFNIDELKIEFEREEKHLEEVRKQREIEIEKHEEEVKKLKKSYRYKSKVHSVLFRDEDIYEYEKYADYKKPKTVAKPKTVTKPKPCVAFDFLNEYRKYLKKEEARRNFSIRKENDTSVVLKEKKREPQKIKECNDNSKGDDIVKKSGQGSHEVNVYKKTTTSKAKQGPKGDKSNGGISNKNKNDSAEKKAYPEVTIDLKMLKEIFRQRREKAKENSNKSKDDDIVMKSAQDSEDLNGKKPKTP